MADGRPRERRRFRRRTVRVLVEYLSDAGLCRETATTLGAGGLFVETDRPLPKGTVVKLAFTLPGGSLRHAIEGRVAWTHQPTPGSTGSPGMGIAFSDREGAVALRRELERMPD